MTAFSSSEWGQHEVTWKGRRGLRPLPGLCPGGAVISLGRGSSLQERREEGRMGRGEPDVFLFDVNQAESQSAHVNELGNAIRNIYILEPGIQNSM